MKQISAVSQTPSSKGESENIEGIKSEYEELRANTNSNADYFRKELENIRRSQEKLENSFADKHHELKPLKIRMDNAEE